MTTRIRDRQRPLSGDWIAAFGLMAAVGLVLRQPVLVGLGGLVLLAWAVARVWDRLALEKVSYTRTLSQSRAFAGETVQLQTRVANRKTLPLPWVQVTDEAPAELVRNPDGSMVRSVDGRTDLVHTTALSWHEEVGWTETLHCERRGVYVFGPASVESGDIFGFFRRELRLDKVDRLVVYPRVAPLQEMGLPAGKPFGETRGGNPLFEDPTWMRNLRTYQPGDPLKRIDWKASARQGQLQVRVYEPTVTHALMVVLNGATTVGPAALGYSPELLERAVTAAASVAAHAFEQKYSVGFLTNAHSLLSETAIAIPTSRAPRHLGALLEAMATVGQLSSARLEDFLWEHLREMPLGATIALVTAVLPDGLLDTLLDIRRMGYRLAILWVGDIPMRPMTQGGVQVYDVGAYFRDAHWRPARGERVAGP